MVVHGKFGQMKNICVDRKINPSDSENNCRSYFTFKAFPEFFTPHNPTCQALQLHPTHQREGNRAPSHAPTSVRGPPTLWRVASPFSPLHQCVFSIFFSSLTQPHLAYFKLCMYPIHQGKTLPHADEAHLTSNISDLSLPRCQRNTSLKPTLYNTWSTQDRSRCCCWRSSRLLKTDLVDPISIFFPIYLSFPQSLTLSSSLSLSLTEFSLWMNRANGFLFC